MYVYLHKLYMYLCTYIFVYIPLLFFLKVMVKKRVESCKKNLNFVNFFEVCEIENSDEGY